MLDTPLLFLVFNRPTTTKIVFEAIREVKPKYLYVAADGPRNEKIGEIERCELVRSLILNGIDWECEVKTLFRDENLGCGKAVSEAISWFFNHVEEGIILEDDCLPNQDFFEFCSVVLKKFKDDKEIMHITGFNVFGKSTFGSGTYYFSKYPHIWGWATWARAWEKYDFEMKDYDLKRKSVLKKFSNPFEKTFWNDIFRATKIRKIDTWDYQWMYSIWKNNGLCVNTNFNFISNVGFGEDATHTIHTTSNVPEFPIFNISEIVTDNKKIVSKEAEVLFAKEVHGISKSSYWAFFNQKFKNLSHKIYLLMFKK